MRDDPIERLWRIRRLWFTKRSRFSSKITIKKPDWSDSLASRIAFSYCWESYYYNFFKETQQMKLKTKNTKRVNPSEITLWNIKVILIRAIQSAKFLRQFANYFERVENVFWLSSQWLIRHQFSTSKNNSNLTPTQLNSSHYKGLANSPSI